MTLSRFVFALLFSALASRYSTKGLADHPRLFNAAIHPPEVQMFRVTMDLLAFPDARCNDGSPGHYPCRVSAHAGGDRPTGPS